MKKIQPKGLAKLNQFIEFNFFSCYKKLQFPALPEGAERLHFLYNYAIL